MQPPNLIFCSVSHSKVVNTDTHPKIIQIASIKSIPFPYFPLPLSFFFLFFLHCLTKVDRCVYYYKYIHNHQVALLLWWSMYSAWHFHQGHTLITITTLASVFHSGITTGPASKGLAFLLLLPYTIIYILKVKLRAQETISLRACCRKQSVYSNGMERLFQ